MGIPTGGGTEVLKTARFTGIGSSTNQILLQGEADHIYTVLSVVFVNTDSSNNRELYFRIYDGTGTSNEHYLLKAHIIPAGQTFVWNDKFVISGAYNLRASTASGDTDITITYIEQDWS